VKPPRIKESPVNMECKLIEELRFGDGGKRSIVLGEVLRFHVRDDVLTPRGHVDLNQLKPVGRLAGSGYIRLSDRFDIKRMSYAEWRDRKRSGSAS
jgi:flavin reductase (DIM6/NTAB) family NADH-FMN oxidoreductase RutF